MGPPPTKGIPSFTAPPLPLAVILAPLWQTPSSSHPWQLWLLQTVLPQASHVPQGQDHHRPDGTCVRACARRACQASLPRPSHTLPHFTHPPQGKCLGLAPAQPLAQHAPPHTHTAAMQGPPWTPAALDAACPGLGLEPPSHSLPAPGGPGHTQRALSRADSTGWVTLRRQKSLSPAIWQKNTNLTSTDF